MEDNNTQPRLYGVLSTNIDDVWEEVTPYLIKTLEYSDNKFTINDIYNALKNKDMQLWVAYQNEGLLSFAITEIIVYPTQKRLGIPFVGGIEMFKWLHFFEIIRDWAKEQGCTTVEGYARPGWERVLEKYGFKKIYSIITATL